MTSTPSSEAGEGPVLTVITKRLRALKKKLNRITQMEQILEKGVKSLNTEQLETIRSKPSIISAIDELEKIRPLISAAVVEETALAAKDNHNEYKEVKETRAETEPVEDLLKLIYFGATFDLMEQNDFTTVMLTRAHERQSCLSYDTFSNESDTNPLCEKDLDLVAKLGKILMSSPVDLNFSHKYSLQLCVQRAKKWLENSDQPIDSDSSVTYAELRAKLNKIMTSGYFTATPVIQATVDIAAASTASAAASTASTAAAAAAAENSIFEVSVGTIPLQLQQTCEEPAAYQENGTYDGQSSYVEESSKDEFQTENIAKEENSQADDLNNSQAEEQNNEDSEWKEINNRSRRNDSNHRGGRGGGRRGFPNGRGSRGRGRGGGSYYQNGHSQNHENGKSYPRSYSNNQGRGGNVNNNLGLGAQRVNTVVL